MLILGLAYAHYSVDSSLCQLSFLSLFVIWFMEFHIGLRWSGVDE